VEAGEIIARLLWPTDQQATKPIHPAVRALDDPTSSAKSCTFGDFQSLFAASSDVRREAKLRDPFAYLLIVVALVET
jgi:hypothetical protein